MSPRNCSHIAVQLRQYRRNIAAISPQYHRNIVAISPAGSTRHATPMHDQFALLELIIICPGVMGTLCSSDLPPSGGTEGVVPFPIGGPGRHEHVSRCTAAAPTRIPCAQLRHVHMLTCTLS